MVEKQQHRTIIFYKDYFEDFFVKQRDKVKDKIIWTFDLIEELQRVPETYLKKLLISFAQVNQAIFERNMHYINTLRRYYYSNFKIILNIYLSII